MNRLILALFLFSSVSSSLAAQKQSIRDLLKNLGDAATKATSGYAQKELSKDRTKAGSNGTDIQNIASAKTNNLDYELKLLADDLAAKVTRKNKGKLAIADFGTASDKNDRTYDYIRDQIEMNLINADNIQVMDRKHIQALLAEHNLGDEGFIDERVAKTTIAFIKVDGWVLAQITKFGEQVKIQLKAVDVSTSQIYAVSTSNLIDISELKKCDQCDGTGVLHSKANCPPCKGRGSDPCYSCGGVGNPFNGLTGRKQACETCAGKGKISCNICSGSGQMTTSHTCSKCRGSGKSG